MGKLIIQQFVSADGFAADVSGEFDLFATVEGDTEEFDRSNEASLERVGAILLGRRTYEEFVTYWPTVASQHEVVGSRINSLPIHVFSRSLTEAPWGDYAPAMIESGDATDAVVRLKREVEGDLIVWGSLTLTEALFGAGLVDVLRLVVLPVGLGSGRGVLPASSGPVPMTLTATTRLGPLVELEYDLTR